MIKSYESSFAETMCVNDADISDLAVCVEGDRFYGRIDPSEYLDCGDDLERLNYMRFCLALDIDKKYLKSKNAVQLKEIFEEECEQRYGGIVNGPLGMAVVLSSLFGYYGKGINGDYFIVSDSRRDGEE